MLAGVTSLMYAGDSTLAAPTPTPAAKRARIIISAEPAAPAASALRMKSRAAATMTRRRPHTSANRPARNAPTAQPGSRALTVIPSHASLRAKVLRRPS